MWFIVALVVGIGVASLVFWTRSRGIKISWYEWLIGIVGLLLLLFTIQNYFGSVAEFESAAAGKFWIITGIPAIVLVLIAGVLSWRRQQSA
jgi:cytochrome b subunit of formate dehydrogenase